MTRPLSTRPRQPHITLEELRPDEIDVIRRGFSARVDVSAGPNGCWPWRGHVQENGYGKAAYGRQRAGQAHRLSYELNVGPIPDELSVCHNCPDGDRKDCVNPTHLWLGTNSDNQRDAVAKGTAAMGDRHGSRTHPERLARGEAHGQSKLTADQVRDVRRRLDEGESQGQVARLVGVEQTTIGRIARRETWRHVA